MEFPKRYMRKTALVRDFGIPEAYLMRIFRTKGNGISWKINPKKERSPIIFDTEGLKKWMEKGK